MHLPGLHCLVQIQEPPNEFHIRIVNLLAYDPRLVASLHYTPSTQAQHPDFEIIFVTSDRDEVPLPLRQWPASYLFRPLHLPVDGIFELFI